MDRMDESQDPNPQPSQTITNSDIPVASMADGTPAPIAGTSVQDQNQNIIVPTASGSGSQPRTRMLLACDRCRVRKSKCDKNLPCCSACLQAGTPCMTADRDRALSQGGRHVPRDYIETLERQVQELEAQYSEILQQGPATNPGNELAQYAVGIESAPGVFGPPQNPVPGQQLFQMPASTLAHDPLSFEGSLFQAIRVSGTDPFRAETPNILFGGLSAALNNVKALDLLKSMDVPTLTAAIDNYTYFIHAHYPLLIGEDIRSKFNIMMSPNYQVGGIAPADELVIYLVIIVGMITSPQFRSVPIFPQMLYYTALRTPGLFDDPDSMAMTQALILIAVYSLYDPCAGSSWHLLDIVASKCLSNGLHLISSSLGNGVEGTTKAWAFWTLYSLDRMTGASMGRPFTIANDDIVTVPVPGVRRPGQADDVGYLSGPLIVYYQLLYRARRDPDAGFLHWQTEFDNWCNSTKESIDTLAANSTTDRSPQWLDSMHKYIDLVYYQGLLLIPQFNTEFPTVTQQIHDLYSSETMYHAAKMVGLSFGVHRFPLAWTAGCKAFATGMSYLLCVALRDRTAINLPEIYHVVTACTNVIEGLAGRFDGMLAYGRFLARGLDMMLRLYNVEGNSNQPIAHDPYFLYTPYSDAIPRSPDSGVPRPPHVDDLHVRRFRCLSRLYLTAMEDIRIKMFPGYA